jgi:hypothetical protein
LDVEEHTLQYADTGAAASAEGGTKIGRYQLLELVGTGGMGMVWGAWDPELERRVALKLVRLVGEGARERMLREGQVLARLSHPNVVPIYDVGAMGDQVYLVMEWVRGTTLRAFAKEKPAERDVLDAFRQAAAGLAAAHEAGVIHRDFKPANAIRGDDGRVRVLDFGIAYDEASPARAGGGTPRYMAPEQRTGEVVTAAADQYAFCISLLETFGPDATPRWIAAIIERGTEPDPARRFPSMHTLIEALARDPARRRRRAAVGVALVGAALGAFAIGRSGSSEGATVIPPCSGAASELASSWNPTLRDRMVAHLSTLGPLAEGDKLAADLDRYGATWIAAHEQACQAHERKAITPALYQTRLTCLARTRSQLAAVGEVMSTVPADDLQNALRAARSLPNAAGCADIAGAVVPPPAAMTERVAEIVPQIERALVLATARRADAAEVARTATLRARETGYEPLIARALLVEGRGVSVDMRQDARSIFAEAMRRGLRASEDTLAVEAYARWIFELARKGETRFEHWDVMVEVAGRLDRDGRFARALMYNNRAVAYFITGDNASARTLLEQAQAAAGDLEDLELLAIGANLVRLERDPAAHETGLRAIHDRHAAALGPDHPDTLAQRLSLALIEHDRNNARAAMLDTCAGFVKWQQFETARLCTFEAAMLALDAADHPALTALMADVVAQSRTLEMRDAVVAWITGVQLPGAHLSAEIAATYLSIVEDAPDRDVRVATLERRISEQGAAPWHRLGAVDGLIVLERWARADELSSTLGPMYARRRAQVQRGLARTLASGDLPRAQDLARSARSYYQQDPSAAAAIAELDAILTAAR